MLESKGNGQLRCRQVGTLSTNEFNDQTPPHKVCRRLSWDVNLHAVLQKILNPGSKLSYSREHPSMQSSKPLATLKALTKALTMHFEATWKHLQEIVKS